LAELPPQMTSEGQVFLLTFLNRRQEAITGRDGFQRVKSVFTYIEYPNEMQPF
jgi:hypothetical protein